MKELFKLTMLTALFGLLLVAIPYARPPTAPTSGYGLGDEDTIAAAISAGAYADGTIQDEDVDWTDVTLTDFVSQTAWRIFYSDTNGDVTELALGAANTFLGSDGTTSAPSFQALIDADIPSNIDPDKIGTDGASNNKVEADNLNIQSIDLDLVEGKMWVGSGAGKAAAVDAIDTIIISLGNDSDAITTGKKITRSFCVAYKHDLESVTLTTDEVVGSMTVDIWIDALSATTGLANITDADSIYGDAASEPNIADASSDNNVVGGACDSGECTDIAAGKCYVINVDATATLTYAMLIFQIERVD